MHSKVKLFVLAALTALALTALAGPATAASFRIEPQGNIEATSEGKLTFGEGEITIECEVTLNGTVSSALISKLTGTQIGRVTAVRINEAGCRGGSIAGSDILGLPWPIIYSSILGTLPERMTGILISIMRAAFNLRALGGFVNCLYSGDPGSLMAVTGRNPYTSGRLRALPTRLPLIRGSFCPEQGSMNGNFNMTPIRITRS